MKTILLSSILAGFVLAVLVVPVIAADTIPPGFELPQPGSIGETGTVPKTGFDLVNRIGTVGNWVFAIFLAVSIIYIVMAAFQFVTGGPDGASEARQKLILAAIGISLALLAQGFDDVLRAIIVN